MNDFIKKHNFEINSDERSIIISVSASVFPVSIIIRTAYQYIDGYDVIMDTAPENRISVKLISLDHKIEAPQLERLGFDFNKELLNSFLKNLNAERYADLRNSLFRMAMTPMAQQR